MVGGTGLEPDATSTVGPKVLARGSSDVNDVLGKKPAIDKGNEDGRHAEIPDAEAIWPIA